MNAAVGRAPIGPGESRPVAIRFAPLEACGFFRKTSHSQGQITASGNKSNARSTEPPRTEIGGQSRRATAHHERSSYLCGNGTSATRKGLIHPPPGRGRHGHEPARAPRRPQLPHVPARDPAASAGFCERVLGWRTSQRAGGAWHFETPDGRLIGGFGADPAKGARSSPASASRASTLASSARAVQTSAGR
jgi:hypothetical protein